MTRILVLCPKGDWMEYVYRQVDAGEVVVKYNQIHCVTNLHEHYRVDSVRNAMGYCVDKVRVYGAWELDDVVPLIQIAMQSVRPASTGGQEKI